MKNCLVPTALALASAACLAQTSAPSVTLYGIADIGVTHVSGLRGGSQTALSSGIMEGSRLGVRGSEDLGGGFRAIFTLEHRIELDTGDISSRPASGSQLPDRISTASILLAGTPAAPFAANLQPLVSTVSSQIGSSVGVNLNRAIWDRQAYLGLITPVGAVLAGRQYTPAYEVTATFDALGTQSSLSLGQIGAIPATIQIRANDALQYRIQLGGISAGLMVTLPPDGTGRLIGAMAMYKTDSLGVGIGYNQTDNELDETALKTIVLGAYAKAGPGNVHAVFGTVKDDRPAGLSVISAGINAALAPTPLAGLAPVVSGAFAEALKQDARFYQLGYKLPIGPHTLYVAYNRLDDRRAADADTASYGVAYTYSLSKRTDLNVALTRFDNRRLAQAAPGQAGYLGGVTASAGTDSNAVAAGIRHRF